MPAESYKVLRVLNEKGTVKLVRNSSNGKNYVLKSISAQSVSMYEKLAALEPHEHLGKICECIEFENRPAAVCEYIEGNSLQELLDSGRMFTVSDIRNIVSQLCDAVEYLHKYRIIHRDINPKNIMLDHQLKLKLIDFGIARIYNGKKELDTTIFGTEGYSAPEQYGFRETGYTADVYSIGIVCRLLLNSCDDNAAADEVCLRKVVSKCTAFDPEKRYQSAAAVKNAIKRAKLIIPLVAVGTALTVLALITTISLLAVQAFGNQKADDGIVSSSQTASAAASTAESTSAVTAPTSETIIPEVFRPTDMDAPNKITVVTEVNDMGYYEDVFEYVFYDDPSVCGEWVYFNTLDSRVEHPVLTADYIESCNFFTPSLVRRVVISDNGKAELYLEDGSELPWPHYWTNGYLIQEYPEGKAAQSFFTTVIDGIEFLVIGDKTGDFYCRNQVICYDFYVRK